MAPPLWQRGRGPRASAPSASAPSPSTTGQLWRILPGDKSSKGLLVRDGFDIATSTEQRERLEYGSVVEQVELRGVRLHYQLQRGNGPQKGWVTIKSKSRDLAQALGSAALDDVLGFRPGSLAPGDAVHVYSVSRAHWAEDGVVKNVAPQDMTEDGEAITAGSVLVLYDQGAGIKWVPREEQQHVLRRGAPRLVYAEGDRVRVWSHSAGAWADDGVVDLVAGPGVEVQGEAVPVGSAFVVYNGGQGMKCILPVDQADQLQLLRPAEARFGLGEPVHVWSINGRCWFEDGVVRDLALQDTTTDEGQELPRGTVLVSYSDGNGVKWVYPWDQEQQLRHPEGEPPPALASPGNEEEAADDRGFRAGELTRMEEAAPLQGIDEAAEPGEGPASAAMGEEDLEQGEMLVVIQDWVPDGKHRKPALELSEGNMIIPLNHPDCVEDGWLYGQRAEGTRGWFPATHVKPAAEVDLGGGDSTDEDDEAAQK